MIVLRSPRRCWWFSLTTIAGLMLAIGGASACAQVEKGARAAAGGATGCGCVDPMEDSPVVDKGRSKTPFQLNEPAGACACCGPRSSAGVFGSPMPTDLKPRVSHPVAKNLPAKAPVRLVCHTRVRVTRLRNGSVLCWRELPANIVAIVPDNNDDTASNGDDTADDDDSLDELNGDDDTVSPIVAWLQAMVPEIAPYCPREMSWFIPPSSPRLFTFRPLRC